MARWNVTRESDKDTYVLDDSSLPSGCVHSGVNTVVVYKPENGVCIKQCMCSCLSGVNTLESLIATQEAGNEIVEV